jgi:hypothetical protein
MENLHTSVLWVQTCAVPEIDVCIWWGIRWTFTLGLLWTPRSSIFFFPSWTRCPRSFLLALVVKIPCMWTSDLCDECCCSWVAPVAKPSPLLYDRCSLILITEFVKEPNAHSSFMMFLVSTNKWPAQQGGVPKFAFIFVTHAKDRSSHYQPNTEQPTIFPLSHVHSTFQLKFV